MLYPDDPVVVANRKRKLNEDLIKAATRIYSDSRSEELNEAIKIKVDQKMRNKHFGVYITGIGKPAIMHRKTRVGITTDLMKFFISPENIRKYKLVFTDQDGIKISPNSILKQVGNSSRRKGGGNQTWVFVDGTAWYALTKQSGSGGYNFDVPTGKGSPPVKMAEDLLYFIANTYDKIVEKSEG